MARVFSNQTDTQEELSGWWAKNIVYEKDLGTSEEILEINLGTVDNDGIEKISDLVRRLPLVKFYYYMVRFLVQKHSTELGLETEDRMSQWADRAVSALNDGSIADESVERLARLAFEDAISNGYGIRKPDGRYFVWSSLDKKCSVDFDKFKRLIFADGFRNKQDFFPIALALNMTYGETEAFLKKALHRETFNVWDENEMLLSLAFSSSTAAKWDLFDELRREYEFAPILRAGIFKANGEFLTTTVRNEAERLKESFLKDGREIRPADPNVREFLSAYKGLLVEKGDYKRTRIRECEKNLEKVKESCHEEMKNWQEDVRKRARSPLCVYYELGSEINIPRGTMFEAIDGSRYRAAEDVNGAAKKACQVEVPVRCTELKTTPLYSGAKAERGFGTFSGKRKFWCEQTNIESAESKSGFRAGKGRKYAGGILQVTVRRGFLIPKGTLFYMNYEKPKVTFTYQSTEDVSTLSCVEVPVERVKRKGASSSGKSSVKMSNQSRAKVPAKRKGASPSGKTSVKIKGTLDPELQKQIRGFGKLTLINKMSSFLSFLFPKKDVWEKIKGTDFINDEELLVKLRDILKPGEITATNVSNMKGNKKDTEITRERILTSVFLLKAAELELVDLFEETRVEVHKESRDEAEKRQEYLRRARQEYLEKKEEYEGRHPEEPALETGEVIKNLPENRETAPLKRAFREYLYQEEAYEEAFMDDRKNVQERQNEYITKVNETMEKCGMTGYYAGNPYDLLLKYLITTAQPFTAFRNLWSIVSCLPERRTEK